MKRIFIVTQFLGTNYSGYQIQPGCVTVQEEIQKAVKQITQDEVLVESSGRTDAGVHALAMPMVFDVETKINSSSLGKALNTVLPDDIRVLYSTEVNMDFNVRYDVIKKTYEYYFYASEVNQPYIDLTYAKVKTPFEYKRAKSACAYFFGEHDFAGFCNAKTKVSSTVRKIFDISLSKTSFGYKLSITGNGFLYNMVRIIAGTLIEVGQGKIEGSDIPHILNSLERARAGQTAPAKGLVLARVEYADFDTNSIIKKE